MSLVRVQHDAPLGAARRADARGIHEPQKYLITGGAGFIGSHLTEHLLARGHRALLLDDMRRLSREPRDRVRSGNVEPIVGSVPDPELVEHCVRRVDVCVNFAASLVVARIVAHALETLLVNVPGTDIAMASADRAGCRMLIASSSEMYGKRSAERLAEDADCTIGSPARSRWSYRIAKQSGAALASAYVRDGRAEMTSVRFFDVAEPRQSRAHGMVLPRFVTQGLAGKPLTIYGDGSQSRCFTSVHDAVRAVDARLARASARGAAFNVGVSKSVRIDELARLVITRTGSRAGIDYIPCAEAYGPGYEELGRRVPDKSALPTSTGWTPVRSLEEIIDEGRSGPDLARMASSSASLSGWQQARSERYRQRSDLVSGGSRAKSEAGGCAQGRRRPALADAVCGRWEELPVAARPSLSGRHRPC